MVPFVIAVCFLGSILPTDGSPIKKTWDYTVLSTNSTSDDKSVVYWDIRLDRINRGSFALSGTMLLNVGDGSEYYIGLQAFRSATGNNNYKLLPLKVPKQSVKNYLETTHKKLFMESLADCSDLPVAKGNDPIVLENKTYTLNKCTISTDSFPSYMIPGFYKLIFNGYGPVEFATEFLIRIEPKS